MKIVYLTPEAPREGQASYVHVHEIVNELRNLGVDITLYEPPYTKDKTSPPLLLRMFHCLWMQCLMWVRWPRGAILYVRAHYLSLPSAVIARLFNIPIIHEVNGPYEDVFVTYPALKLLRPLLIPILRWQYKSATALIAVTHHLVDWVNNEAGRDDCVFISNGANINLFRPDLPFPKGISKKDKYVIFFGGLTRWHGVPTMLSAAKQPQWPSAVKLLIIGDGQESDAVIRAAQKNKKIVYIGRKPYADIAPYIANALAGIVMISDPGKRSSTGVFPLKLFETLSCGVPVIVSDLPGQAQLIRNNHCGYVLPINDAQALAKQVGHIEKKPKEAKNMGEKGRQLVVSEHSWQIRAQQTYALLSSLGKKP